jgi:hypothetical protein
MGVSVFITFYSGFAGSIYTGNLSGFPMFEERFALGALRKFHLLRLRSVSL